MPFGPADRAPLAAWLGSMIPEEHVLARRRALHHLVDESRRMAAGHRLGSPEHDFYAGVRTAAEDGLSPHHRDAHGEAWLAAQAGPFRDGYTRTAAMIAASHHELSHRYQVPDPG